jgi:hypothetical protein
LVDDNREVTIDEVEEDKEGDKNQPARDSEELDVMKDYC